MYLSRVIYCARFLLDMGFISSTPKMIDAQALALQTVRQQLLNEKVSTRGLERHARRPTHHVRSTCLGHRNTTRASCSPAFAVRTMTKSALPSFVPSKLLCSCFREQVRRQESERQARLRHIAAIDSKSRAVATTATTAAGAGASGTRGAPTAKRTANRPVSTSSGKRTTAAARVRRT